MSNLPHFSFLDKLPTTSQDDKFARTIREAAESILGSGAKHWRESRMRSVREIGESVQEIIRGEGEFKNLASEEHRELVSLIRSFANEPTPAEWEEMEAQEMARREAETEVAARAAEFELEAAAFDSVASQAASDELTAIAAEHAA